ncbi:MAG: hypothetical protein HQ558_05985 [Candidatus Omnitrophica bacterium]|nr:hypothetical protein [Candidatus Omnitrophota bacterium]
MGKKRFLGFVVFVAMLFAAMAIKAQDIEIFEPFNVYTDKNARGNHYVPSGWMGDYSDVAFTDACTDNPHTGNTCIKVAYRSNVSQGARWAGMYWQNPPNNWGNRKGGYDLTGAKKLTFWIRGEEGGERVEEIKIGGMSGTYPDSDSASVGPIVLTKEWQQHEVNLKGLDLSYISGGFCWATNLDVNPDGATFYIDDIRYE